MAVPARRLRPSTPKGQPRTIQRSPGLTTPKMEAASSPRTIATPSGSGKEVKAPVQSSAAHKNSGRRFPDLSASDASGVHGAAIVEVLFSGPGKIHRPSFCVRSGPHTKQPGNLWLLNPMNDCAASSASSYEGPGVPECLVENAWLRVAAVPLVAVAEPRGGGRAALAGGWGAHPAAGDVRLLPVQPLRFLRAGIHQRRTGAPDPVHLSDADPALPGRDFSRAAEPTHAAGHGRLLHGAWGGAPARHQHRGHGWAGHPGGGLGLRECRYLCAVLSGHRRHAEAPRFDAAGASTKSARCPS